MSRIKNIKKVVLSDNWYTLNKFTYEFQLNDNSWVTQQRESYDKGDGAVILLYNTEKQLVVLTKQFRLPTYINGNDDGFMIEACAGVLDDDSPEDCIRKEVEEETGYRVSQVKKIMEAYSTPGSVTEILHYFIAEYQDEMKVHTGGGVPHESEDIEVLELPFREAVKMMYEGSIKDAKTIILLQYALINELV
jgi:nudix-type nucleoside diphosphatase (YffH/AdpP family)